MPKEAWLAHEWQNGKPRVLWHYIQNNLNNDLFVFGVLPWGERDVTFPLRAHAALAPQTIEPDTWSEHGPEWKEHHGAAEELQHVQAADGLFWMAWEDFARIFTCVQLCKAKSSPTAGPAAAGEASAPAAAPAGAAPTSGVGGRRTGSWPSRR